MKVDDVKARVRHFTVPTLWDAVDSIVDCTIRELGLEVRNGQVFFSAALGATWEPPGGLHRPRKTYPNGAPVGGRRRRR